MKKLKLIPAVVFVLLVITYLSIYSAYNDDSIYEGIETKDLLDYAQLEEVDQIKIIGLPQDSVVVKSDFTDKGKEILSNIDKTTYIAFQNISSQMAAVSEQLYYLKRLILLLFLFTTTMVAFKHKFKFNVTFQKALFENVKTSLLFVLFAITSLLITQSVLGTVRSGGQMVQIFLSDGVKTLKYALLYSVFISAFIYFHPQNIHWYKKRIARKQAKLDA